jgi:hypothetical protein
MGMAKASKKANYKFNKLQTKWLSELESGTHKQTSGRLYSGRGYCCLGVACALAGLEPQKDGDGDFLFEGEIGECPASVREQLKLRDSLGEFYGEDGRLAKIAIGRREFGSLAEANDKGVRFKTIAAFIRQHPEAVFYDA